MRFDAFGRTSTVAALLFLATALSACKPPPGATTPEGEPVVYTGNTSGKAGIAGVPFTDKITFDLSVDQDLDDPAILHFTAYPMVDKELLSEHPDGRLVLEFHAPYGTSLVAGMFRQRMPLAGVNKRKASADIRVINRGKLEFKVVGTIIDSGGNSIITGEKIFKVVSGDDATVELDQEKIAGDEAREEKEKAMEAEKAREAEKTQDQPPPE